MSCTNLYLDLPHIIISGHCRVPKKALKKFVTVEDITSLLKIYDKYFNRGINDKVGAPISEVLNFGSTIKVINCNFGMEIEDSMSWEIFDQYLGLQKRVFPLI